MVGKMKIKDEVNKIYIKAFSDLKEIYQDKIK